MKTSGKTRVLRIGIYEWRVYSTTTAAVHTNRQTSRVELNATARPWRIIFKLLTGYEENQNLIIPTGKKEGGRERAFIVLYIPRGNVTHCAVANIII